MAGWELASKKGLEAGQGLEIGCLQKATRTRRSYTFVLSAPLSIE
jgi:hypothetical protein